MLLELFDITHNTLLLLFHVHWTLNSLKLFSKKQFPEAVLRQKVDIPLWRSAMSCAFQVYLAIQSNVVNVLPHMPCYSATSLYQNEGNKHWARSAYEIVQSH